jgi:hypothetical protein
MRRFLFLQERWQAGDPRVLFDGGAGHGGLPEPFRLSGVEGGEYLPLA